MLAESERNVVGKHTVNMKFLEQGKALHAEVKRKGYESDTFVGNTLVSMYGKCGSVVDALDVFNRLPHRSVVGWTAMLAAHLQQGEAEQALQLYEQMREEDVSPNNRTFVIALEACGVLAERDKSCVNGLGNKAKVLEMGKMIHADLQMKGYEKDAFVGSTLVNMYGKCESIVDAQDVFDRLLQRDVVSWNVMIAAHVQQGQAKKALDLYNQMQQSGIKENNRTFVSVLQACGLLAEKAQDDVGDLSSKQKYLELGQAIHANVENSGYYSDLFVGNTLISMYGKCGSIADAQNVFDTSLHRNVVTWNAMLAAYTENGQEGMALKLYQQMKEEGIVWDARTCVSVLQACCLLADKEYVESGTSMKTESLSVGRALHADAEDRGFASDVFVGNTLICMYGKCRSISDAQAVFDSLSQRSLVSWNVMLSACVEQGHAEKALQLYSQMKEADVDPNLQTFLCSLQACGVLAEEECVMTGAAASSKFLEMAKAIHGDARKKDYHLDVFIGSTLISMYRRCGSIVDAQKAFDEISHQSVVSWTAILVAYAQQDQGDRVVELYRQMQREGVRLDDIAMVCILRSCSSTGGLEICREIHETATSNGSKLSPLLATALIHAYGRCASMVDAQSVFNSLCQPDVVSWSALIAGHAREGNYLASVQYYELMQRSGVRPDAVTFLSLLSVCSHAGLVDKGVELFESMSKSHGINPGIEHYVSMIDLLGRAGYFDKIEHLLKTMPVQPDLAMWLCLLGACRKHGKVALGRHAFDGAVRLRPQESAAYVLMLNIYTDAGLLDCAKEVKELRQQVGAWKKPGQSWIENELESHTFLVRDGSHPQQEQLYDLLGTVAGELEEWRIQRQGVLPEIG